jgi:hypothetical protein
VRGARWLLGFWVAAWVATASGATEERSSLATCGHLEELAAAKRALQEGDQASALIHLRNADALLSKCAQEAERADQPVDTEPTDETEFVRAEAPPTPAA